MTTLPLVLASLLYLWQMCNFIGAGNYGMALCLFAYSLANVGLIWAASSP